MCGRSAHSAFGSTERATKVSELTLMSSSHQLQKSLEKYRTDHGGDTLKIEIQINFQEKQFCMVKYFTRHQTKIGEPQPQKFEFSKSTLGWRNQNLRSFKIFETISASIIKIKSLADKPTNEVISPEQVGGDVHIMNEKVYEYFQNRRNVKLSLCSNGVMIPSLISTHQYMSFRCRLDD